MSLGVFPKIFSAASARCPQSGLVKVHSVTLFVMVNCFFYNFTTGRIDSSRTQRGYYIVLDNPEIESVWKRAKSLRVIKDNLVLFKGGVLQQEVKRSGKYQHKTIRLRDLNFEAKVVIVCDLLVYRIKATRKILYFRVLLNAPRTR